jgi:hypothetical protein
VAEQFSHRADIFLVVRPRITLLTVLAALGAASVPTVAVAATPTKAKKTHHKKKKKGPTLAQKIQASVKAAESSPDLWATVNCCGVCTGLTGTDSVGIRGQMPSLGYTATESMIISVEYWNYDSSTFQPADVTQTVTLGQGTNGLHQDGVNFPITPPAPGSQFLVRGTITFEWTIASKVVGKVTRDTGHGYANVGYANPPGYTSGTCTLT